MAAPFFPKGAFNVVLGQAQVGSKVVSHKTPALVSITGSVRAGLQVAASAAANLAKAHLELGGKAPVLVFEDADLDKAVEMIALTGYFNAGQDCTAATRVIVAESVHDEFLAKLVEAAKNTRFGDPDDQDALYGPLNNANQLKNVKAFIDNLPAHAKVETGGKQADRPGFYFEPTVISGLKQHDEAIQNEIFGPVITVQKFTDENDAIEKANDVEYGLASSVWTKDHARIFGEGNTLYSLIGSSIFVWLVHWLVSRGIKEAAIVNLLATIAKIIPMVVFIFFTFIAFKFDLFKLNLNDFSLKVPLWQQVKDLMLITLWVFTGIEGAVVLSSRAKNRHDIGKATILGVLLALSFYVMVTVLAYGVVSREALAGMHNPSMATILQQLIGLPGTIIITIGLIISVSSSYLS
ncbi:aldehyde dehydrogenase family protein, partial [Acinetobacter baumannii]